MDRLAFNAICGKTDSISKNLDTSIVYMFTIPARRLVLQQMIGYCNSEQITYPAFIENETVHLFFEALMSK
jgi:hypothetical protein